MKINQVAVQLYSVRDHLKTPDEVKASVHRLREIGYEEIEIFGEGPLPPDEMARLFEAEGLRCCSSHEPSEQLLDNPQASVEKLKRLGCRQAAYPYPRNVTLDTLEQVRAFAARLNKTGKVLTEAGIRFSYHNHNIEFRRVGGRTILETILAETEARYVAAEIDTYWTQVAGGDPIAWCRAMKGRLPLLHLKDVGVNEERQSVFREIGQGNLNWAEIIKTAERSGCQWFIVEHDSGWTDGDPFKSLKMSFDYLKEHIAR